MIEHLIIANDCWGEKLLQFGRRVGAMCSEAIEQSDLVAGNFPQVFEKPGDEAFIGRCPGDIGKSDTNARAWAQPVTKRWSGDRLIQSAEKSAAFVWQARGVARFDDGGSIIRKIDRQVSLAVSKMDFHCVKSNHRMLGMRCVVFKEICEGIWGESQLRPPPRNRPHPHNRNRAALRALRTGCG